VSIIRDAVRFPNGDLGTYIRILQRKEKLPGVAVLPTCEGKIVLIEHYRHATRDWHLEIPRGFGETASPETNARLEVKEELGTECLSLEPLGTIHTNSGLLSEHVHLFFARVQSCSITDKKEPIRAIKLLGLDDVKTLLCAGQITDSFTVAAMAFAEWRGFLTQL
jgi:ADP-ribose pyrophosphatase